MLQQRARRKAENTAVAIILLLRFQFPVNWCGMSPVMQYEIPAGGEDNPNQVSLGVYPPRAPTIHKLCLKSEMVCKPKPHMIISPRIRSQLRTQLE